MCSELGALQVLIPELVDEQVGQGLSALQCIHRKQGSTQHYAALLSGVPEPDAVARAKP